MGAGEDKAPRCAGLPRTPATANNCGVEQTGLGQNSARAHKNPHDTTRTLWAVGRKTARKQFEKTPAAVRKIFRRAASRIERRVRRQIHWLFRRLAPSADLADARRYAAGSFINTDPARPLASRMFRSQGSDVLALECAGKRGDRQWPDRRGTRGRRRQRGGSAGARRRHCCEAMSYAREKPARGRSGSRCKAASAAGP